MRNLFLALTVAVVFSLFGCAVAKQDLIDWGKGLASEAAAQAATASAGVIDKEVATLKESADKAKSSGDQINYLIYTTLATALAGLGSIVHRHMTLPDASPPVNPLAAQKPA